VVRHRLLPAAHLITPNQFELELLSGVKIADTDGLRAAAAAIAWQRRIDVVATGCTLADTPAGQVETILCADGQLSRFATPRLPIRPYGTGDLLTGLIAAHLAKGTAIEAAVRLAVETIFAVLVRTQAAGSEEMRLVPLPASGN
jgi:pyridoxine kinase